MGRLFTVSGVVCGFRKRALAEVASWSPNVLTDDVEICWSLQLHVWQIRFEARALCRVLMPEALRGLWRQRFRWAPGPMLAMGSARPDWPPPCTRRWRGDLSRYSPGLETGPRPGG